MMRTNGPISAVHGTGPATSGRSRAERDRVGAEVRCRTERTIRYGPEPEPDLLKAGAGRNVSNTTVEAPMVDLPVHGARPETELASQIGRTSRTERELTSPVHDGSGSEPDPRGPAPTGRHYVSESRGPTHGGPRPELGPRLSWQARPGLHRSQTWRVRVGRSGSLRALYAADLYRSRTHVDRRAVTTRTCPNPQPPQRTGVNTTESKTGPQTLHGVELILRQGHSRRGYGVNL